MANPLDFAKTRLRRATEIPGRPSPEFTPEPSFMPEQPPMTSARRIDYTPARPAPAPAAPEAAKTPSNWRAALGAALQGAAYGIQAAPRYGIPGQEFRQALIGGIGGAGAVLSARERAAAEAQDRDRAFAERMALLEARQAGRETPEEAAEKARLVAEATFPTKSKLQQQASAAALERGERLKQMAVAAARGDDEKKGWEWAYNRALDYAKANFVTDPEEITRQARENFAYWRTPKAPTIPKLPD